jgi:GT2 family glycosyltransferase
VIVVDNDSGDGMIPALRREFTETEFIELDRNAGFAAGNNVGIARARGQTLLLLNPDTIVPKKMIDALFERMALDRSIGIIGPTIFYIDGSLQSRYIPKKIPTLFYLFCEMFYLDKMFPKSRLFNSYFGAGFDYGMEQEVGQVCGACMMIKKEVFDKIGLFDERFFLYFDEADLCLRAKRAGFRTMYYPATSIVHLEGASSLSSNRERVYNYYRTQLYFFRKHYGPVKTFALYILNLGGFTTRFLTVPFYLIKDRNFDKVARHFWAFVYHLNPVHLIEALEK